ncbi:unnamed protein product [Gongylonema pulchrum]|uniref:Uncharacterized protein n=1 Tax=Gongylonema pulchrum TaxID=637853 RepID=A0A183DFU3_9BILA|nr:unnamed protein product [Gongylonema pulchrum]
MEVAGLGDDIMVLGPNFMSQCSTRDCFSFCGIPITAWLFRFAPAGVYAHSLLECEDVEALFNKPSTHWDSKTSSSQSNISLSSNIQRPFSYTDMVASPCEGAAGDHADDSPPNARANDNVYKRPGTLDLPGFAEPGSANEKQEIQGPELTNFNADEFIADLPFKLDLLSNWIFSFVFYDISYPNIKNACDYSVGCLLT